MPKKKKILFAITKGNWGGAQRYVFDLATNLPKNSFEVVVACGQGDRLKKKLAVKNIKVIKIAGLDRDISVGSDLSAFYSILQIIKAEKPDILHLNSSKIGSIGALAGRLSGVRQIIFTGHGWAWNEKRNFFSKFLILTAHWLTILLSHKIIAVSENIAQQIKRLPGIEKANIVVVHNGISDTEYLERFTARTELNIKATGKFWIGAISELHNNKGLDVLIAAYAEVTKRHSDTALVIIGEGEKRSELTEQIESLNLGKKVYLLGFVEDARKYLKAFDILVMSSRTEAFPYVPLEAGLAQLPLIATAVGGIPELIQDGTNGFLVRPNDSDELSGKISELLQNTTQATILGHNLRKTVEKNFSTDLMVEKTLSIYNSG